MSSFEMTISDVSALCEARTDAIVFVLTALLSDEKSRARVLQLLKDEIDKSQHSDRHPDYAQQLTNLRDKLSL